MHPDGPPRCAVFPRHRRRCLLASRIATHITLLTTPLPPRTLLHKGTGVPAVPGDRDDLRFNVPCLYLRMNRRLRHSPDSRRRNFPAHSMLSMSLHVRSAARFWCGVVFRLGISLLQSLPGFCRRAVRVRRRPCCELDGEPRGARGELIMREMTRSGAS